MGGLATSVRHEPRFTKDVDFAVAVDSDAAAERLVSDLGYAVYATVEHDGTGRLATARLHAPTGGPEPPSIDLLFASCGIEDVVAKFAEEVELGRTAVPVALTTHLVAMKLVSARPSRPQDSADIVALLRGLPTTHYAEIRRAIELIRLRGYHRGRDLHAKLDEMIDVTTSA